ncbi:hypothetical protein HDU98_007164 [Podochytrium sp. JEL0797]|nr:hypothetical protein HDU98_007164 [Podochytrium sp. JEL0797]
MSLTAAYCKDPESFEEISGYFNSDDWRKDVIAGRIIAVGLDSSPESQTAFLWAINNFITASTDEIKNKLVLLSCIPEDCSEGNKIRLRAFLKTSMEKARELIGPNVPLRAILLRGDPRNEICTMTETLNADVLVVGTRGLTGMRRTMMGSVDAESFEEISGYFNSDDWRKDVIAGRIIAVGLDSSQESQTAFLWAINNITASLDEIKNKLVLLSCIPENCSEANKIRLRAFLTTNMEKARELIGPKVPLRVILLRGDPRDEICIMTATLNADVLVVGTRGLTGMRRTMMGSVSDYLSKHSHCPCVVVR